MRLIVRTLLVLVLSGQALHAQVVRGLVITPDSALVPGVIVTLLDSNRTPVARGLADDGGAYLMRAPAPGTYRIEARRLAFRVTLDVPITLVAGRILVHTLVLTGEPVRLGEIRTTADARCEATNDPASSALVAWEEARKALRASQLTRMTRAYTMDITTFVRRQSAVEQRWRQTDSSTHYGMSLRPFTSRPADELAERGYVTRGAQREVFHAPDEDVLLSESFATTHCLRVLPDSGDGTAIRLGFAPLPDRRLPDITGVLTIDRATSELRRLDFSFVNIPVTMGLSAPGGEIVFRHLFEGSWVIEQWAIWLPTIESRMEMPYVPLPPAAARSPAVASTRQPTPNETRFGLQTTGGRVDRVAFGNETIWLRPRAAAP